MIAVPTLRVSVTVAIPEVTSNPPAAILTPAPAITCIPSLAVIRPIESTFFTSSYINVPPIVTFPLKLAPAAAVSYTHLRAHETV